MAQIGLDIGTTGCKALVLSDAGQVAGFASREYPVLTPRPTWAEQDAEAVWGQAKECLAEAVAQALDGGVRPFALALSVQGEAVIPVDACGNPLRPAILGMDTRTVAQNAWLAEHMGSATLFFRTGMPVHTVNTLPKLLWLRDNDRATWQEAHAFRLYEDFILAKLGDRASISHCLASRTQLYDQSEGDWSDDLLALCDLDPTRLSPLPPGDTAQDRLVGEMRRDLANELGLDRVLLVSGGHDQACAALGSGVVHPGLAMVSTGTAEVVEVALPAFAPHEALRRGNISLYRHIVPGLYLAMTLNHSGGVVLRWFRDALCPAERDAAIARGRDPYDELLANAPNGPTSLLVLPHWAGSGTPWFDTDSRGAVLGLDLSTTRADVAKALIEGLCFELRTNLELLAGAGIRIDVLHAVGGGARSDLWLQLKADICRVPLVVPDIRESACLGAALLAGWGAGRWSTLEEARASVMGPVREFRPDPASAAAYDARYDLYRQVYPALAPIYRAAAR